MRLGTFFLTLVSVFALGYALGMLGPVVPNKAVCHSVTEDGPITDCDYRNGTWYTK